MTKPRFLYHGDRHRLEILEPRQAVGPGGDADNQKGVYAVAVRDLAIPFAITFVPLANDALFTVDTKSHPPRIFLKNTEVQWERVGYLYTLPAHNFEQIDEHQWISRSPVTPLTVEEIDPARYRQWIEIDRIGD